MAAGLDEDLVDTLLKEVYGTADAEGTGQVVMDDLMEALAVNFKLKMEQQKKKMDTNAVTQGQANALPVLLEMDELCPETPEMSYGDNTPI